MNTQENIDIDKYDYFREKLKHLLRANKITNVELAKALDCTDQTISDVLNNKTKQPWWINTCKLVNFLQDRIKDFDINYLFNAKESINENFCVEEYNWLKYNYPIIEKSRDTWKRKYKEQLKKTPKLCKLLCSPNINLYVLLQFMKYLKSNSLLTPFYMMILNGNFIEWLQHIRNYSAFNTTFPNMKKKEQSQKYFKENQELFQKITNNLIDDYKEMIHFYHIKNIVRKYDTSYHFKQEEQYLADIFGLENGDIKKEYLNRNISLDEMLKIIDDEVEQEEKDMEKEQTD